MLTLLLLFLIGIALLYVGAEVLVSGSSGLALKMGIRPLIIGFTVVAMGTSSPELAVSMISAIQDTKGIALGNIIGSNIANIALVIGVAALIRPLEIQINTIRREMPYLILTTGIFYLLSLDHVIDMKDGLILLVGFSLFIMYMVRMAQKDRQAGSQFYDDIPGKRKQRAMWLNLVFIALGLTGLVAGSTFMVNSAKEIATQMGISEVIIGISLVALGTSLPELAISSVGAIRGEVDLAVGNAVGSNLFNILFVIALVSIVSPIPVETGLLRFDYIFMMVLTIAFLPMMISKFKITRYEGALLVVVYIVYIWLIYR